MLVRDLSSQIFILVKFLRGELLLVPLSTNGLFSTFQWIIFVSVNSVDLLRANIISVVL
jgi:hypothetical protein